MNQREIDAKLRLVETLLLISGIIVSVNLVTAPKNQILFSSTYWFFVFAIAYYTIVSNGLYKYWILFSTAAFIVSFSFSMILATSLSIVINMIDMSLFWTIPLLWVALLDKERVIEKTKSERKILKSLWKSIVPHS